MIGTEFMAEVVYNIANYWNCRIQGSDNFKLLVIYCITSCVPSGFLTGHTIQWLKAKYLTWRKYISPWV